MAAEFIHRFVRGAAPYTLLVLHGSEGSENDLIPVGRAVAPGASILSPRGKLPEGEGARFFARNEAGEFDEQEIAERAAELASWIGVAAAQYELDASKIFALGYSNGAIIASAVMLLYPAVISGGVLLRPRAVMQSPNAIDLKGAPVLIVAGKLDNIARPESSAALGRQLAEAGANVDFAVQDAEHDLTPQDFAAAKRWLADVLS